MISIDRVLEDLEKLPTLPVSLARISAAIRNEKSSMADLESALRLDPALTTNLLKVANSAYFGCRREITSLRQAITLLGTKKVHDAAVGGVLASLIPKVLPGYGIQASTYFAHSVAVSVISEKMLSDFNLGDTEDAFTCGLLHDIGKLVTSTYLANESSDVVVRIRERHCTLLEAEREVLGIDHAQAGAAICEKWGLPDELCHVIRNHHEPSDEGNTFVDVVHVADCLSHAMGFGVDLGELSREVDKGALERLKVPVRELERVVSETIGLIDDLTKQYTEIRRGG